MNTPTTPGRPNGLDNPNGPPTPSRPNGPDGPDDLNAPNAHRVFRCDLFEEGPRGVLPLGGQLQVLLSADLEPRWLHAADTVAVPAVPTGLPTSAVPTLPAVPFGSSGPPAPTAEELFARLPGCRAVVVLGPSPAVHLRAGGAPLPVPDAVTAGIVAALADACPRIRYDLPVPAATVAVDAVTPMAAVTPAASPVRSRPCTAGTPTASAVLRLRGRTVRCEWRALR